MGAQCSEYQRSAVELEPRGTDGGEAIDTRRLRKTHRKNLMGKELNIMLM
jgi:hypothetical protein